MDIIFGLIMSILFTLAVFCTVFIRVTTHKKIEIIDWFLLFIAVFNGMVFCFVIISTYQGNNIQSWNKWILQYDCMKILEYVAVCSVFVFSLVLGWNIMLTLKKMNKIIVIKNKSSLYNVNEIFLQKSEIIAWIMFFVGLVSYILYSRAYGGLIGLLNYSSTIRSGMKTVYNPFSFLQRFGEFTLFASYVFYGLIIEKKSRNIKNKLGFIISFLSSLYILYSLLGRVGIVIYLCTFLLSRILLKYKKTYQIITRITILMFVGIIVLVFIDKILGRTTSDINIIKMFTKELSFPFASFIAQSQEKTYRWFFDLLIAPIYILPMRIWGSMLNIKTASAFNTFIMSGGYKGTNGVTGEIPTDLITFSYMQLSIIGVILIGIFWGVVLYILKILIGNIPSKGIKSTIYSNVILNVLMMSVLYGDTQHIIVRNFPVIIGCGLMWMTMKISKYDIVEN